MGKFQLCSVCRNVARYRIWTGYFGYAYYCQKCKERETMEDK